MDSPLKGVAIFDGFGHWIGGVGCSTASKRGSDEQVKAIIDAARGAAPGDERLQGMSGLKR
jgi:DNA-binding IclR family transcriptional regulator